MRVLDGRYRLQDPIGRGGMGVVYAADDLSTGARVAVKIVSLGGRTDAGFHRELRIAARLSSPYVCEVLGSGSVPPGGAYLVMPLLSGMPLRKLIGEAAPLSVPLAVRIADQILSALEAAHAAGVIHRDLKPENVFLLDAAGSDFVKVLDFGVGRVLDPADELTEATRTGGVTGTANYLAPEQARGQRSQDARVDIYAAGVVLYEMLTGRRPFEGGDFQELQRKILFEPFPPPRAHRPDLPRELGAVVLRALARNRDERFADASSMRAALLDAEPAPRSADSWTELTSSGARQTIPAGEPLEPTEQRRRR
ncbi:MAG: serine/threonine protein kinase [Deltaproteobacteria bacterium]|nr:serine/threonine protein kinase [Deltaproteobacteria bacterium]